MSGPRLAECRECSLPIVFATLTSGKKMPLNPKPNHRGNVACKLAGGELRGRVVGPSSRPATHPERLYMAHFATCTERTRSTPAAPAEPDAALF